MGILIKTLKKLNVIICSKFSEFSFLNFSRFLLETKGPELSRKVRETISCNLALARSKSDVMGPSYGQTSYYCQAASVYGVDLFQIDILGHQKIIIMILGFRFGIPPCDFLLFFFLCVPEGNFSYTTIFLRFLRLFFSLWFLTDDGCGGWLSVARRRML